MNTEKTSNENESQPDCLGAVSGSFSIGEMGEDRFAPVLKDGKETNCRIYLWDAEDVKRLQSIGDEIHRQTCR
jgi:hypothetical protein